jgi:hypothetical protein
MFGNMDAQLQMRSLMFGNMDAWLHANHVKEIRGG